MAKKRYGLNPFNKATSEVIDLEFKERYNVTALTSPQELQHIVYHINNRNSFKVLQRVVAYMLRFIEQIKRKKNRQILYAPQQRLYI